MLAARQLVGTVPTSTSNRLRTGKMHRLENREVADEIRQRPTARSSRLPETGIGCPDISESSRLEVVSSAAERSTGCRLLGRKTGPCTLNDTLSQSFARRATYSKHAALKLEASAAATGITGTFLPPVMATLYLQLCISIDLGFSLPHRTRRAHARQPRFSDLIAE